SAPRTSNDTALSPVESPNPRRSVTSAATPLIRNHPASSERSARVRQSEPPRMTAQGHGPSPGGVSKSPLIVAPLLAISNGLDCTRRKPSVRSGSPEGFQRSETGDPPESRSKLA